MKPGIAEAVIAIHGELPPIVTPFPVIELGHGRVGIADSLHDMRLPALLLGKNGQGMGVERVRNNYASDGETLAVVTFENVEGLDVLLEVIERIRRDSFPEAKARDSDPVLSERFSSVWNDALEEAAIICDRQSGEPECPERAEYCADEIRALKALTPTQSPRSKP